MSLSLVALFSGSVAINDYRDVTEDAINAPDRPLVKRSLPHEAGLFVGLGLLLIGAIVAWQLGLTMLVFASTVAALSLAYTYALKDIPVLGNAIVALVSCGAFACWGVYKAVDVVFWQVAVALFWIRLGGELIKTAHDEPGDTQCQ